MAAGDGRSGTRLTRTRGDGVKELAKRGEEDEGTGKGGTGGFSGKAADW